MIYKVKYKSLYNSHNPIHTIGYIHYLQYKTTNSIPHNTFNIVNTILHRQYDTKI